MSLSSSSLHNAKCISDIHIPFVSPQPIDNKSWWVANCA